MVQDPKDKKEKGKQVEWVREVNPDDVEAGEELPGFKKVNGTLGQIEKERDLNPDDFE
ncbi:hypothetical protein JCM16358_01100 [Halanaerocella petrolearia]